MRIYGYQVEDEHALEANLYYLLRMRSNRKRT